MDIYDPIFSDDETKAMLRVWLTGTLCVLCAQHLLKREKVWLCLAAGDCLDQNLTIWKRTVQCVDCSDACIWAAAALLICCFSGYVRSKILVPESRWRTRSQRIF